MPLPIPAPISPCIMAPKPLPPMPPPPGIIPPPPGMPCCGPPAAPMPILQQRNIKATSGNASSAHREPLCLCYVEERRRRQRWHPPNTSPPLPSPPPPPFKSPMRSLGAFQSHGTRQYASAKPDPHTMVPSPPALHPGPCTPCTPAHPTRKFPAPKGHEFMAWREAYVAQRQCLACLGGFSCG